MSFDFSGKAVLVTGGTRGIGAAIALAFRDAGATVVVCGRTLPDQLPAGLHFVAGDVRESGDVTRIVAETVAHAGRLDVLVNNAGGSPSASAATASPRFSRSILALNLTAPLDMAQAANAVMQTQAEGGVILNIASVSGIRPSPGTAAYGAAKAGLINLTRSLAIEWAPRVRVNAVVAGMVRTLAAEQHYGGAEGLARVAATVPLLRLAEPADIAAPCLFLASTHAAYVTGAALVVDGGGERPSFLQASTP